MSAEREFTASDLEPEAVRILPGLRPNLLPSLVRCSLGLRGPFKLGSVPGGTI